MLLINETQAMQSGSAAGFIFVILIWLTIAFAFFYIFLYRILYKIIYKEIIKRLIDIKEREVNAKIESLKKNEAE